MSMPIAPSCYPISFVDDATGETLVVSRRDGMADIPVAVQKLSTPGPDIREAVTDRPGTSGTNDSTQLYGSAAVTLALTVLPRSDAHLIEDQLRAWQRPSRRIWIVAQRNGWLAPRKIYLRGDAIGEPTSGPGPYVRMMLAWKAIKGVWEAADETVATVFPIVAATGGLSFPLSFPVNFGTGSAGNAALITVGGTEPVPPVIRIYGPAGNISIANHTSDRETTFKSSYSLAAGSYVSIDTDTGRILADDDPSISRRSSIDWSVSDLWQLQPGQNLIALTATGIGPTTKATLTYGERTF